MRVVCTKCNHVYERDLEVVEASKACPNCGHSYARPYRYSASELIPIFNSLARIKKESPDLRLGQIIVNALGEDPYYVEDDVFEKRILEHEKWLTEQHKLSSYAEPKLEYKKSGKGYKLLPTGKPESLIKLGQAINKLVKTCRPRKKD
jgi:hypothetical protein